ncbi:HAD family hydrolase [Actinomadura sp. 3N407]|uniref:HAD family hydrolase n=1 Tax=Actinomadura sp. 3N407 TaxID=3457423 RepID=UPI003FCDEDC4
MRTLVLWDIDHTLINAGGLSAEIYAMVFHRLIGHPPEKIAPMAGRTDRAITIDTLRHHGIDPAPDLMAAFTSALAESFAARQDEFTDRGYVLPGANPALKALADRPDVIQSALTGNMKQIAVCKLTAFALIDFFDLEAGAYAWTASSARPW